MSRPSSSVPSRKPFAADRQQALEDRALERIRRRKQGREQRQQYDREQQQSADHGDFVAREAREHGAPVATRRLGDKRRCGIEYRRRRRPRRSSLLVAGMLSAPDARIKRSLHQVHDEVQADENSASASMVPCSSGMSRWKIAVLRRKPEPGQENTVSTRIDPPIR